MAGQGVLRHASVFCTVLLGVIGALPLSAQDGPVDHVSYGDIDPGQLGVIRAAIDQEIPRVIERLGLTDPMPVTVEYWQDEEAYQEAMMRALGQGAPGSRGYITGPQNARVLVTGLRQAPRESVHEVVHSLTLQLNPEFGNNPRWLWESTAQYYAEEQRDESELSRGLQDGCPTMDVLNAPFDRGGSIYTFGYSLADEVVRRGGEDALRLLIVESGDTETVLGVSLERFHREWCDRITDQLKPK